MKHSAANRYWDYADTFISLCFYENMRQYGKAVDGVGWGAGGVYIWGVLQNQFAPTLVCRSWCTPHRRLQKSEIDNYNIY